MSEIAKVWFDEAKKLPIGKALFIPVQDKKEQTALANDFEDEREAFSSINAVHASQIFINKTTMDGRKYVVLDRKNRAPFTAFMRDENGQFSKVSVDPDRRRMLMLMLKDKKEREEIEVLLNGLTEDEEMEFFPQK